MKGKSNKSKKEEGMIEDQANEFDQLDKDLSDLKTELYSGVTLL